MTQPSRGQPNDGQLSLTPARFARRSMFVLGAAGVAGVFESRLPCRAPVSDQNGPTPDVRSLIPVVGDGKWVWTEAPENQTGYLEPRRYEATIGVELRGTGQTRELRATTTVPVELPEQRVEQTDIDAQGCQATLRRLTPSAGQLLLTAGGLSRGQTIVAAVRYSLTLFKAYQGFTKGRFPVAQQIPASLRTNYLGNSPGIQTHHRSVSKLATEVAGQIEHPWDKAKAYHEWVWSEIKPRVQYYTTVVTAIRDRIGDCEERAAIFVALCRASGIPARLVWVPNHNWAEFYLNDLDGQGHWIPAHTSAYPWFGWTGVHEMVLQKGDRVHVPEKRRPQRLLADWMQWQGRKPHVRYFAELKPQPNAPEGAPGPGTRSKDTKGEWLVAGNHALDRVLRDGERVTAGDLRLRR